MTRDGADPETFAFGWLMPPRRRWENVGSVTLPNKPTTLGEARGGLEGIGGDEPTARWLRGWAESVGDERDLLLRLPSGWFELCNATIASMLGNGEHYLIRFDKRCSATAPAE